MAIPKQGELAEYHLKILRTIKRLQPCGSTSVARALGKREDTIYRCIYYTLYRRGLVENDIIRQPGRKPCRKPGTIRLTPEGERILDANTLPD